MTFTPDVYAQIRDGAIRSANAIVPTIIDLFTPRRVLDVGCGEGWWARAFAEHGVPEVLGLDETAPTLGTEELANSSVLWFRRFNLEDDIDRLPEAGDGDPFDLAVCLEVAEHIPASYADRLIAGLCHLAPAVLFSAAIPGQTGHGHVNEQWPGYWAEKFETHGFEVSGDLRWQFWGDERVEPWYQQNMLVALHPDRLDPDVRNIAHYELFGPHALDRPIAVVHPVTFEHLTALRKAGR